MMNYYITVCKIPDSKNQHSPRKRLGFHLIELLIVMFILIILSTLGLPLYTQHFLEEARLEAESSLLRLAVTLEQYRVETNSYQNATLSLLHFPETIANHRYQLAIASVNEDDFEIHAQPAGKQLADSQCGTLTLNARLEKGITGNGNAIDCWHLTS